MVNGCFAAALTLHLNPLCSSLSNEDVSTANIIGRFKFVIENFKSTVQTRSRQKYCRIEFQNNRTHELRL